MPLPPSVSLASLSCSLQAFGTVRLNAIIFCSAAILRSIALRSAPTGCGADAPSAFRNLSPCSASRLTGLVLGSWVDPIPGEIRPAALRPAETPPAHPLPPSPPAPATHLL